jgi:hypothetical protein
MSFGIGRGRMVECADENDQPGSPSRRLARMLCGLAGGARPDCLARHCRVEGECSGLGRYLLGQPRCDKRQAGRWPAGCAASRPLRTLPVLRDPRRSARFAAGASLAAFPAGRFRIAAAPVPAVFAPLVRVGHCAFARPAATVLNGHIFRPGRPPLLAFTQALPQYRELHSEMPLQAAIPCGTRQ